MITPLKSSKNFYFSENDEVEIIEEYTNTNGVFVCITVNGEGMIIPKEILNGGFKNAQ